MKKLTKEQAVIISAYTGIICCPFSDFHAAVEKRLKRPVYTHEFAFKEIMDEIKNAFKKDFVAICN